MDAVLLEKHPSDGVARIVLNRPDRLNPLGLEVVDQLPQALSEAERDPAIGAAVITGAGRAFSAGGDMEIVKHFTQGSEDIIETTKHIQAMLLAVVNSRLPVIAAVNGLAYGAAFNLMLACDLAVAAAGARFCQAFIHVGIIPDLGGLYLLPRRVGAARAKELMLFGETLTAQEALAMGLVNRVEPDAETAEARAMEWARKLAASPRETVATIKRLVNRCMDLTLEQTLEVEAMAVARILGTSSQRARLEAFLKQMEERESGETNR